MYSEVLEVEELKNQFNAKKKATKSACQACVPGMSKIAFALF
jgi:hypothetical protein